MRYSIGLDIGIASVGYSILELDASDMPMRIVRMGTRIFEKAENPKDGSSLAAPRREARGLRRRLRRHRHRLERIRGLIVSCGILDKNTLEHLYDGKLGDIYELRTEALDRKITNEEFARILIHLAQRRGFKSNRKAADEADDEGGKLLSAISENKDLCITKGYRTVGEMMYKDPKFSEYKRNKSQNYANTVDRESVEAEARLIFECQRRFGSSVASETLENEYVGILVSQRSFAEGPGSGPYSGNQIERMRGKCTFEEGEPRAAKATYSFESFNLWQHINHIRVNLGGKSRSLDDSERMIIFSAAHDVAELSYAKIRKLLNLSDDEDFVGIRYEKGERDKAEKKEKLRDLKVYHEIRKCLKKVSDVYFTRLTHENLDAIGEALSKNLSDDDILNELKKNGISDEIAAELIKLPNFSKYGHLSIKACKKLLPHLEVGMTYDKACEAAGYNFKAEIHNQSLFLPPIPSDDSSITSPVVRRALSQTIKVINAIIREMGNESPVYINIELAREMSKSLDERNKIKKAQDDNARENEKAMEQLREYMSGAPKGQDIVKYKLWKEQDGRCPYSGEAIELERLTEPGYVDVDHIVPYSRCFDDRMVNKVLVKARENRQKGNRLPLEYLKGSRLDEYIVRLNSFNFSAAKKSRLLKESISDENEWKQRNLQDTQFISSYMYRYINNNMLFAPSAVDKKRRVLAVNGAITGYVRKRWGINKIREDGDMHHAIDAVIIACVTQGMINKITEYSKYKETEEVGEYVVDKKTGEIIGRFPRPWPHFSDELAIRLTQDASLMHKMLDDVNYESYEEIDIDEIKPPFVSHMCNHKVTGAAHKETVRSGKLSDYGMVISKVALTSLKLNKEGEIEGYFNPESDRLLYSALKERLQEFGGDAKKAFEDSFYKPRSDGSRGPLVKKVKIVERASRTVSVLDDSGVADNDTLVRCDVYYVEGEGYYFVPIYVADTVKDELPNLTPTSAKDENGNKIWKPMVEENFVFSLYRNDLFKMYSKRPIKLAKKQKESTLPDNREYKGDKGVFLYFKGYDIATTAVTGITHDSTYEYRSSCKTCLKLEKYEVDILGNVRMIEKEKRQRFGK
ncbi:MAG: type II CRISPR RNA-guided endonuclease Cas9 [Clostridia bacterium]|nr:type II CRISPR RNA-guided endonuclease Cas9 [Clostridia bacterium]